MLFNPELDICLTFVMEMLSCANEKQKYSVTFGLKWRIIVIFSDKFHTFAQSNLSLVKRSTQKRNNFLEYYPYKE